MSRSPDFAKPAGSTDDERLRDESALVMCGLFPGGELMKEEEYLAALRRHDTFILNLNTDLARSLLRLHSRGIVPDLVIVQRDIKEHTGRTITKVDLRPYFDELPNIANWRYYADRVQAAAMRHDIAAYTGNLNLRLQSGADPKAVLESAAEWLGRLSDSGEERPPRFVVRDIGDLIAKNATLKPVLIDGLLRLSEVMNVIASPKVGKSWFVLLMVFCVATGMDFLGFRTTRGRVLLLDNELHPETLAHRMRTVADALGIRADEVRDWIDVVSLRGKLVDVRALAELFANIPHGYYSLVVLDAKYRFMPAGGDENSNGAETEFANIVDGYAERTGAAFVQVHHSSKGNQSGKAVTDVGSGAGAQSRTADTHAVLRPHEQEGAVVLDAAIRSFKQIQPICLRFTFPLWSIADDLDPAQLKSERPRRAASGSEKAAKESATERAVRRVREELAKGPATKNRLKAVLHISGQTVNAAIDTLFELGELTGCEIETDRGPQDGYRLRVDPGQPRTTPDCPPLSTVDGLSAPKGDGLSCPGSVDFGCPGSDRQGGFKFIPLEDGRACAGRELAYQ